MRARVHHGGMVEPTEPKGVAKRLGAVEWGLFFVWIGIAFLTGISVGISLLGVAIITLGMQLVRRAFRLKMEGFWLAAGLVFLVGGIWVTLNIGVDLVAMLLIVAGVALLVSAFGRKRRAGVTRL